MTSAVTVTPGDLTLTRSADLGPLEEGGDVADGHVTGVGFETQVPVVCQQYDLPLESDRGVCRRGMEYLLVSHIQLKIIFKDILWRSLYECFVIFDKYVSPKHLPKVFTLMRKYRFSKSDDFVVEYLS